MKNRFFWSTIPKIYEMVLGLTIGIAIINYLGPEDQGKIGFIINLISIMSFLFTLGIGPIYSRFISVVNNKKLVLERTHLNLGLRLIGFFIFFFSIEAIILSTKENLLLLSLPLVIGKLFTSLDLYSNIAEGSGNFKKYAISKIISLTLVTLFRIYCLYFEKNIYWIVASFFIQDFLLFLIYFLMYDRFSVLGFTFCKKKSLIILTQNYKLALSSIVVGLFTQMDVVMISLLLDNISAGEFYASTRLSTPLNFIAVLLISTYFNELSKKWKHNKNSFFELISFISGIMFYIYLSILIFIYFFGEEIFFLFFNNEYTNSLNLFYIHISGLFFLFLGPISGKYLIIKKDYSSELSKTLIAAIVNILFNVISLLFFKSIFLVAISSVISYFIANYAYFIYKKDYQFIKSINQGFNIKLLIKNYEKFKKL
ncbi:oligosaccharide flippase family protein [Proteus mirabilis]|uniref:Wzx n=3 Tax=Proteus TaxID=583 RepID=A0A385JMB0_PROMI|nr:oligosaccharide flippase family protein [Proteus mirabilis]AXY99416.1 wzx [Proteus mirabilis]EKX6492476.1 oligosaccharide flippase family protein [Proteus mirabilis]ELA7698943.1 oligosaccharide flippase family protein [Proteus mirabilis]ELA7766684.1 oligosaccharide flippase family protein [Proteus mirabilis]ELA9706258.1 oligosaccharide flippase family protein [Proteus mirabilis]